nr:uncharacterized protein LOC108125263 [Drosophila bipectinata]
MPARSRASGSGRGGRSANVANDQASMITNEESLQVAGPPKRAGRKTRKPPEPVVDSPEPAAAPAKRSYKRKRSQTSANSSEPSEVEAKRKPRVYASRKKKDSSNPPGIGGLEDEAEKPPSKDEAEKPIWSAPPKEEAEKPVWSIASKDEAEKPIQSTTSKDEAEKPVWSIPSQDEAEKPVQSRSSRGRGRGRGRGSSSAPQRTRRSYTRKTKANQEEVTPSTSSKAIGAVISGEVSEQATWSVLDTNINKGNIINANLPMNMPSCNQENVLMERTFMENVQQNLVNPIQMKVTPTERKKRVSKRSIKNDLVEIEAKDTKPDISQPMPEASDKPEEELVPKKRRTRRSQKKDEPEKLSGLNGGTDSTIGLDNSYRSELPSTSGRKTRGRKDVKPVDAQALNNTRDLMRLAEADSCSMYKTKYEAETPKFNFNPNEIKIERAEDYPLHKQGDPSLETSGALYAGLDNSYLNDLPITSGQKTRGRKDVKPVDTQALNNTRDLMRLAEADSCSMYKTKYEAETPKFNFNPNEIKIERAEDYPLHKQGDPSLETSGALYAGLDNSYLNDLPTTSGQKTRGRKDVKPVDTQALNNNRDLMRLAEADSCSMYKTKYEAETPKFNFNPNEIKIERPEEYPLDKQGDPSLDTFGALNAGFNNSFHNELPTTSGRKRRGRKDVKPVDTQALNNTRGLMRLAEAVSCSMYKTKYEADFNPNDIKIERAEEPVKPTHPLDKQGDPSLDTSGALYAGLDNSYYNDLPTTSGQKTRGRKDVKTVDTQALNNTRGLMRLAEAVSCSMYKTKYEADFNPNDIKIERAEEPVKPTHPLDKQGDPSLDTSGALYAGLDNSYLNDLPTTSGQKTCGRKDLKPVDAQALNNTRDLMRLAEADSCSMYKTKYEAETPKFNFNPNEIKIERAEDYPLHKLGDPSLDTSGALYAGLDNSYLNDLPTTSGQKTCGRKDLKPVDAQALNNTRDLMRLAETDSCSMYKTKYEPDFNPNDIKIERAEETVKPVETTPPLDKQTHPSLDTIAAIDAVLDNSYLNDLPITSGRKKRGRKDVKPVDTQALKTKRDLMRLAEADSCSMYKTKYEPEPPKSTFNLNDIQIDMAEEPAKPVNTTPSLDKQTHPSLDTIAAIDAVLDNSYNNELPSTSGRKKRGRKDVKPVDTQALNTKRDLMRLAEADSCSMYKTKYEPEPPKSTFNLNDIQIDMAEEPEKPVNITHPLDMQEDDPPSDSFAALDAELDQIFREVTESEPGSNPSPVDKDFALEFELEPPSTEDIDARLEAELKSLMPDEDVTSGQVSTSNTFQVQIPSPRQPATDEDIEARLQAELDSLPMIEADPSEPDESLDDILSSIFNEVQAVPPKATPMAGVPASMAVTSAPRIAAPIHKDAVPAPMDVDPAPMITFTTSRIAAPEPIAAVPAPRIAAPTPLVATPNPDSMGLPVEGSGRADCSSVNVMRNAPAAVTLSRAPIHQRGGVVPQLPMITRLHNVQGEDISVSYTTGPDGLVTNVAMVQPLSEPDRPVQDMKKKELPSLTASQLHTILQTSKPYLTLPMTMAGCPNIRGRGRDLVNRVILANEQAVEDEEVDYEEIGVADTFAEYWPSKLKVGVAHPDPVVETATLSSVEFPDITYKLSLPERTTSSLSALQLEAVVYACQAHEKILPSGERAGFLLGDGAGVGKGRTIASIIYDNYLKGRKRALWISVSNDLKFDAERDFHDIGALDKIDLCSISKFRYSRIDSDENDNFKRGVIFCTYTALIGESLTSSSKYRTRLKQITRWLGKKFNGVIVFDECHKAKNLSLMNVGKSTKTGTTVLQLQKVLPNARVVYASATGASEPRNMAYMVRLGLWGPGTAYPDFYEFVNTVEKRGIGAMEIVAMDMKLRGTYISRQLSFRDVSFRIEEVPMSKDFRKVYNLAAELWAEINKKFQKACRLMCVESRVQKIITCQFWCAHQRFFKNLCIAAKVNHVVRMTRQATRMGKAVVIGLQSTGESRTLEHLERHHGKLNSFVSTSKMIIQSFVEKHFPAPKRDSFHHLLNTGEFVPESRSRPPGPKKARMNPDWFDDDMDAEAGESDIEMYENSWISEDERKAGRKRRGRPPKVEKAEKMTMQERILQHLCNNMRDQDNEDDTNYNIDNTKPQKANITERDVERCICSREVLLEKIEVLGRRMPPNTLDKLISDLGGPTKVAEMTGRRGRVVRTEYDGYKYEPRCESDTSTDLVNYREKQRFMNGSKHVAIISEAASSGISLQSDKRVSNQRRRLHITLELPWSADRAIQQFGRTHRSNQVNSPEYVFVITDLAGERRFASTVAKRLESLGALTQGDRRATDARDLSQFNIDNSIGRSALENVMQQLTGDKTLDISHLPTNYKGDFAQDCARAMAGVGMLNVREENKTKIYTVEKDSNNIPKFLNRILGCRVEIQNALFKFFLDKMYSQILQMKRSGRFDLGILDLDAHGASVKSIKLMKFTRKHSTGEAATELHTVKVERGMSFEIAVAKFRKDARQDHDGFYVLKQLRRNKNSSILCLPAPSNPRDNPPPPTTPNKINLQIYRPNTGPQVRLETLGSINNRYVRVSPDVARPFWQEQYDTCLDHCSHSYWNRYCPNPVTCEVGLRIRTYHVLSGLMLPIWDRIEQIVETNGHKIQIIRVKTDVKKKIVGTVVPHTVYDALVADLSTDSLVESFTPPTFKTLDCASSSSELAPL